MRYLTFCYFFSCLWFCFGQTKNNKVNTYDILEGDSYLKKLQKFDYEPQYQIEVETYYVYELRVNDLPVANCMPPATQTMYFPLNTRILESGEQTISFNIYPRYYENDDTKQREYLENPQKIDFKIRIYQTAWVNGSRDGEKEVFSYTLSKDIEELKNITEKTRIYKQLTFKATIPYKLEGWSKSEVFNQKDSTELENKVYNFYNKYRQLMTEKKGYEIEKLTRNRGYELAQSFYFTKEEMIKRRKTKIAELPKEKFFMAPIKDYKLIFYGNNRVLGLVFKDEAEKGMSCINKITTDSSGELEFSYRYLLLHQPKGAKDLEVIR